jgi:RHS repeat-associated protein
VSVYDGSQVVWTETGTNREQMVSQGTTQALLWAPGVDQLLAIQERLGGTGAVKQPVWALTDHLGTVKDYLAKAPTAGAESGLLLTRRYSAFGTPVAAKVWSTLPIATFTDIGGKSGFFYVGQEYDATTGLQYSRARYYDPVSSEFISQDPLGFAGGDTNLYRRAGNSPANATDPSGMIINVAAGAGIGAVIGGGFYLVSNYVSGRDFNWSDFAIATASGAVSGAVAGATGGASLLAQAASGAAAGAAGGAVYGGATSYAAGGSLQQVAGNALSGAAVGAVAGLAGGAVTGRLLGANPAAAVLGQRVTANAAGGATGGAIGGGFDGYVRTGTLAGTLEGAATGLVYGGVVAGGLTAAGAAVRAGSAAVRRAFAPISAALPI